jgi:hypothetical protein
MENYWRLARLVCSSIKLKIILTELSLIKHKKEINHGW